VGTLVRIVPLGSDPLHLSSDFGVHRFPKVWHFLDDTAGLFSSFPSLATVSFSFAFLARRRSTVGAVNLQYSARSTHLAQHTVKQVVARSKESCEGAPPAKQVTEVSVQNQ
jgi:hypothetical protein